MAGLVLLAVSVGLWMLLDVNAYLRTTGLLLRAVEIDRPALRPIAGWQTTDVDVEDVQVNGRRGPLDARLYLPSRVRNRAVLLVTGVNGLGIDEPRLRHLATEMARSGTPVLTPQLPDLLEYRITPQLTDDIEDAALGLLELARSRSGFVDAPAVMGGGRGESNDTTRIGMMGISFSGGLALVAAGRPALRHRVAFVFAYGAHANLPRVVRYLATGDHPDHTAPPPHDYGGVILLMNFVEVLVPAGQAEPLRLAIARFLLASHTAMFDESAASRQFAEARRLADQLPPEAAHIMRLVNARDTERLGAALRPHLEGAQGDPALSPDESTPPDAPVFLLHSADDSIIPTGEAHALAEHLRAAGTPVRVLVTPVLGHAEVQLDLRPADVWALLRFWTRMPWT
jgi:dienelactone hydrolase